MVRLWQRREEIPITARHRPESNSSPRNRQNVICNIPAGAHGLYMGSTEDSFNTALRAKGRGPFGFTPVRILYHLILWGERPVWVSSSDCELKDITEGDDGLPPA